MKPVIVGTAGHIDHGKSALVQALTGIDPDRLKEEKQRGITIDLGFAFLQGPDGLSLGFVDVPGHERFVKNMLAGVGGIDLVMLVVAADESVMPQTREHFEICRLLEVQRGIIAITKSDLVETELRELAAIEVRELVKGSFLEQAPLVYVSAKTGEGVAELKRLLFEVARTVAPRPSGGLLRLPVDRAFSMRGFGTVVTGTLVAGSIRVDEEVEILPAGRRARVRGLQVHGESVPRATAGQRTAVNLQGVEVGDVSRGDTLAHPYRLASTRMLDAMLEVLSDAPVAVKDLTRVHLHLLTAQVVTRVRVVGPQGAIGPGQRGLVQLRLESPIVAVPGDRFIIRRYSPLETLGGGVILDASPPKHSVKRPEIVERLSALAGGDRVEAAALFVSEGGMAGVDVDALARRLGVDEGGLESIVTGLLDGGKAHRVEGNPATLVTPEMVEEASRRIISSLGAFHRAQPLREGMPKSELREKVIRRGKAEVFEWLLQRLSASDTVRVRRDLVAAADHEVRLSDEEQEAATFLLETYRKARYRPSKLADVAQASRRDLGLLERVERVLLQEGRLVKLSEGMVFHREALEELKAAVRRQKKKGEPIDVAFFKQLAGVTRKHAIPLLEWLDKERVTRRQGGGRVVL